MFKGFWKKIVCRSGWERAAREREIELLDEQVRIQQRALKVEVLATRIAKKSLQIAAISTVIALIAVAVTIISLLFPRETTAGNPDNTLTPSGLPSKSSQPLCYAVISAYVETWGRINTIKRADPAILSLALKMIASYSAANHKWYLVEIRIGAEFVLVWIDILFFEAETHQECFREIADTCRS